MLIRLGFAQGVASANVFAHDERKVAVSVHGDDLIAIGPANALDWYEEVVGAEYDVKIGPRLGPRRERREGDEGPEPGRDLARRPRRV